MKITKESHKLMSFFVKNNCLMPLKQTNKTNNIFKNIYNEFTNGVSYIEDLKTKNGSSFYKLKILNITNVKQIQKPTTFPPNAFPSKIIKHINDNSLSSLTYSFNIFNRNINIIFLTENENIDSLIETYNNYVDYMLVWLYIVDKYASKNCSTELNIYIYHTTLLKLLPSSSIEILDENNVNTAFTRTCSKDSEIVVFRKEEWFKVFIHETFHNFGLDFSDMNQMQCKTEILSIFNVNSEVNLFESYTEFWARLINTLFCSYSNMKNKHNIDEFLINSEYFINFEIMYSFFQMVKVLDFMSMKYTDLYENSDLSENVRNTMYKENTSVLSYYILTLILFNNYQEFLSWCNTNNNSLLQFKKTTSNLNSFCKFIEKKYKSKRMLNGVNCSEDLLVKLKNNNVKNKQQSETIYLLHNLRMTICELG
jgi:hypothetical protein